MISHWNSFSILYNNMNIIVLNNIIHVIDKLYQIQVPSWS